MLTTKLSGNPGHSEKWILEGDGYIHGLESSVVPIQVEKHTEASEVGTCREPSPVPALYLTEVLNTVVYLSVHLALSVTTTPYVKSSTKL